MITLFENSATASCKQFCSAQNYNHHYFYIEPKSLDYYDTNTLRFHLNRSVCDLVLRFSIHEPKVPSGHLHASYFSISHRSIILLQPRNMINHKSHLNIKCNNKSHTINQSINLISTSACC